MKTDWIGRLLRSSYPTRDGEGLRKLERVAARIDARTDTMTTALLAISEHLRA